MRPGPHPALLAMALVIAMFGILSCNQRNADVPFPVSDSLYPQPLKHQLELGKPRPFRWKTVSSVGLKPETKSWDIDKIPAVKKFDTSGFRPFAVAPKTTKFELAAIPSHPFLLNDVADKPLKFKTYILPQPVLAKADMLISRTNVSISITSVGRPQGISEKAVLSLLRDKDGMMWIGTDKGMYRYDGETTLKFSGPNSNNGVLDMLQDRQGRIWYIGDDAMGFVDLEHGLYTESRDIHTLFPGLPRMILDDMGRIWITRTARKSVSVINPEKLTYKDIPETNGPFGQGGFAVYQDKKKNIWITGRSGLNLIPAGQDKVLRFGKAAGLGNDSTSGISEDADGNILVGHKGGLLSVVNLQNQTITNYSPDPGLEYYVAYRILEDDKGLIWIGSDGGLTVINPREGTSKFFRDAEGMQENYILDFVQDDRKRMWVATYKGGLNIVENNAENIHPAGSVRASTLMEDAQGRLWLGSSSHGIVIFDFKTKDIKIFDTKHGLPDNFVQNIATVDNEIWITTDGGFDRINPANKTIEHLGKKQGLSSDTLYGAIKDPKGDIWLSGPGGGVDVISANEKSLLHAGTDEGLSQEIIMDVKTDLEGRIWVATASKGVDIIDSAMGTIRNLSQGRGLQDTCFRMLMMDQAGRMWIGTDQGVYIADLKNDKLFEITEKEGLSNNYINSLLSYKGTMVIGTGRKATIVTPPAENATGADTIWKTGILAGSETSGIIDLSNPNWNTNIITRSGDYVWGDEGVTIIKNIREQKATAQTYITGITILNEPQFFSNSISVKQTDTLWTTDSFYVKGAVPPSAGFHRHHGMDWDSVSGPYNLPINLTLPHNQDNIQFQFGQANLGRADSTKYSFILQGSDSKWSPAGNKTSSENYLNLSPGSYKFMVRSLDISGHWTKPAVLSFTILPPWWQTWWMYVLYAIALIGAIFGYNKYRSTALIKQNKLLEEKILSRTREVKQQADELTTINQISQALVGQADLHDLIELVGNQLRDLFKANIVYIALLDKKSGIINFPYQYGDNMQPMKLGEGLTSKIILTGEPLLINKAVEEQAAAFGVSRIGIAAASYLGVPIPVSNENIGVLSIQSTKEINRFEEKDKNLLSTIAANVGVAIRKARLFEEVKQANTEADAARKIAEEANAAKSAFLSTVSHELRTPLTSVLGFAKITKKRLEEKIFPITDKSDPKTAKTIEQISGNLAVVIAEGERLTNLINDVLDLAKIEAGKMEWNLEPVLITDVVERAIASTSSLFDQKNLILARNIEADLPSISADKDKMIQVVINLLSNAVKFTDSGTVTCNVFQKGGGVVVGITDTGIGIAPGDHDKVFEQFKQVGDTLTDKPKGTGLGLPICKEIVEHHNGKIWLESELGKGSTFYFMIPAIGTQEKTDHPMLLNELLGQLKKRVALAHPAIKKEHPTILVVDDDDGIRRLLKQELGEAGYDIVEASNGKEALAKVRSVRPDLILLDVMMPEMNGFDVAAVLKNDPQTMEIPIIILSIVQDKSRGFRIGVDRYLTKPIDTELLFSEIGDLLEQGKSRKRVMVVDEDSIAVRALAEVLEAKGYQVVESDGRALKEQAIHLQPDIIILNSLVSDNHEIVKTLRFEKGLENVLFLIYQ